MLKVVLILALIFLIWIFLDRIIKIYKFRIMLGGNDTKAHKLVYEHTDLLVTCKHFRIPSDYMNKLVLAKYKDGIMENVPTDCIEDMKYIYKFKYFINEIIIHPSLIKPLATVMKSCNVNEELMMLVSAYRSLEEHDALRNKKFFWNINQKVYNKYYVYLENLFKKYGFHENVVNIMKNIKEYENMYSQKPGQPAPMKKVYPIIGLSYDIIPIIDSMPLNIEIMYNSLYIYNNKFLTKELWEIIKDNELQNIISQMLEIKFTNDELKILCVLLNISEWDNKYRKQIITDYLTHIYYPLSSTRYKSTYFTNFLQYAETKLIPEGSDLHSDMLSEIESPVIKYFVKYKNPTLDTPFQITSDEITEIINKINETLPYSGYSDHHTGLAIDISPNPTPETLKLLFKNGFIKRYSEGTQIYTGCGLEDWHFRYVGPELANIINKKYNGNIDHYIIAKAKEIAKN